MTVFISYFLFVSTFFASSDHHTTQDSPFGNKRWALASSTISPALDVNGDGKPDTDLTILTQVCEKDDSELYTPEGTIITYRGKSRCEEDEEDEEETGTWEYDARTKTLTVHRYDSRRPVISKVVSVSAQQIELSSQHKSSSGTHTIKTILKVK